MRQASFLPALLLFLQFNAAQASDATGSWEYRGPSESGMWLKSQQVGNRVRFQLELARGAPSYNSGWIQGEFDLNGASGIFQTAEYGTCEITFEFTGNSVRIRETDY